jgi:hypothetical protein
LVKRLVTARQTATATGEPDRSIWGAGDDVLHAPDRRLSQAIGMIALYFRDFFGVHVATP